MRRKRICGVFVFFDGNQQGRPLPLFLYYMKKNIYIVQGPRPKEKGSNSKADYSDTTRVYSSHSV
jgi:hypothetical protein